MDRRAASSSLYFGGCFFWNCSHNDASVKSTPITRREEGFVKKCTDIRYASAPRHWATISVALLASLIFVGQAQALKPGPAHGLRDRAVDDGGNLSVEGVASSNGSPASESANSDALDNNPVAFSSALKRRCPQILEDPSSYDDDIVALCLQARKRM
jgi:hypothetical protein